MRAPRTRIARKLTVKQQTERAEKRRQQRREHLGRIALAQGEEAEEVPLEALIPKETLAKKRVVAPVRTARENLTAAFDLLGGVRGLAAWGRKNKTEFYRIWSRLVPKEAAEEPNTSNLETLLTKLAEKSDNTVLQAAVEIGAEALEIGRSAAEAEDAAAAMAALEAGVTVQ